MAESSLLIDAIDIVGELNDEQIAEIANLLSVSNINFIKCQETAQKLRILSGEQDKSEFNAKQVADLVGSLSYFRNNLGRTSLSMEGLTSNLPQLFEFNNIEIDPSKIKEKVYKNLISIFAGDDETDKHWHETALIDVVLDFDSFVDLRPVFIGSDDGEDEGNYTCSSVLPIIIFRIALQEDFAGTKSHVFQMTATEFASLEAEVKRIKKRLIYAENLIKTDLYTGN